MLITKIIGKSAQWLCVSSTSASKFEFLDCPTGTGSTQIEFKFTYDTNLQQIYISRSRIYSGYDFRDQHIWIDKNGQVRLKSSKPRLDRFIC